MIILYPGYADAEILSFDSVLRMAIKHSVDIKIAVTDIQISEHGRDEVAALFYPTINLRLDNEYVHTYKQNRDGIVSIGDYVSSRKESTYQHAFTASLRYQISHFDARGLKYKNASKKIKIAKLNNAKMKNDVKIAALNAYAQTLMVWVKINQIKKIIGLQTEIFRLYKKLKKAGRAGRNDTENAAMELAGSVSRLDDLNTEFQKSLNGIGYYTGKSYQAENIEIADFAIVNQDDLKPNLSLFPRIRAIDEEISIKENEKKIIQREMLPQLYMYCTYKMYGSNKDNFSDSFHSLEKRDVTIALIVDWEFFSGFRDIARGKRLKFEIKKLELQREKKIAELEQEIENIKYFHKNFLKNIKQVKTDLVRINYIHSINRRLSENKMTSRISFLKKEIELIRQKLDMQQKNIENEVVCLKLQFWTEGQGL